MIDEMMVEYERRGKCGHGHEPVSNKNPFGSVREGRLPLSSLALFPLLVPTFKCISVS